MQQDSLHYARCLEILGQSPLFSGVNDALLKDYATDIPLYHSC